MKEIQILGEWEKIASQIESSKGVAMILGATDTGKSTLARFLVERWSQAGICVGVVDGDVGQSMIGPPTTISLGLCSAPGKLQPISMRFIGSTSPWGHLLSTVVATKKMVDKSIALGAEITLVNTTGMVYGEAACQLKFQKIELINPRYLLALQRGDEIEHLLLPHEKRVVHRLPVSQKVRTRSSGERRAFREGKFQEYFKEAKVQEFSIRDVALQATWLGSGKILGSNDTNFLINEADEYKNLLVGLNDENYDTLALGIIEELDPETGKFFVLTPLASPAEVKAIQFGSIKITSSGKELGNVRL